MNHSFLIDRQTGQYRKIGQQVGMSPLTADCMYRAHKCSLQCCALWPYLQILVAAAAVALFMVNRISNQSPECIAIDFYLTK